MSPVPRRGRAAPRTAALAALLASAALAASCASVDFTRTTETSGEFRSTGIAITILSIDMPKQALQIARENASDAGRPNMVVETVSVVPNFGVLDWVLDIFSIRYAVITGTWGLLPDGVAAETAP